MTLPDPAEWTAARRLFDRALDHAQRTRDPELESTLMRAFLALARFRAAEALEILSEVRGQL